MPLRVRSSLLAAVALAVLSACATAPRSSGPGALPKTLSLCPGHVSNPPAADGRGRIATFTPYLDARGVTLLRAPVPACLSSGFGARRGGAGSHHDGIDLWTGAPRTAYAGGAGVVESVSRIRGYGLTVIIRHSRHVETLYAHLSRVAPGVRPGRRVAMGAPIAETGKSGNATGVHLHYEIRLDGRPVDPFGL